MGAERLGVPLWKWLGIAEWEEIPECVKQWVFARAAVEGHVAKAHAKQGTGDRRPPVPYRRDPHADLWADEDE